MLSALSDKKIALFLLGLIVGFNENTRALIVDWRNKRKEKVLDAEIFDAEVLDKASKLKVISRVGIGIDNIDFQYAYF